MKTKGLIITMCFLLPIFQGCQKMFPKDESLPLGNANIRTILKNHTQGTDYTIGAGGMSITAECIIEPGVEIKLYPGAWITVSDSGYIKAMGNVDMKIRLILICYTLSLLFIPSCTTEIDRPCRKS